MVECTTLGDLHMGEIREGHGTVISDLGSQDLSLCEVGFLKTDDLVDRSDGVVDDYMDGWASPRISFSQDFVVNNGSPIIRVSPEKRKWDHDHDHDQDECEFEFAIRNNGSTCMINNDDDDDNGDGDSRLYDKGLGFFMLSADELFLDGKLLPLHINSKAYDPHDLVNVHTKHNDGDGNHRHHHHHHHHRHHHQQQQRQQICEDDMVNLRKPENGTSNPRHMNMVRHLSFDCSESRHTTSRDDESSHQHAMATSQSSMMMLSLSSPSPSPSPSMSSSPSPSPSMSSSSPPVTMMMTPHSSSSSSSSSHQSLASTYSARFKTLFKSSNKSTDQASPPSNTTRDENGQNANLSRKMIPIYMSPRSFWPFSRSNSAGEKKSTVTPPCLRYRSNSAGETSSCKAILSGRSNITMVDNSANLLKTDSKVDDALHGRAQVEEECTKKPNKTGISEPESSSRHNEEEQEEEQEQEEQEEEQEEIEEEPPCHSNIKDHHRKEDGDGSSIGAFENINIACGTAKVRRLGNTMKASTKRSVSVCSANPPSKIVLKNLERCSAEKKVGWKQLNRRGSFPVATRVSPVLNVAIYRGGKNLANNPNGFFGNLFTNPKKDSLKPKEGALNWRKGA